MNKQLPVISWELYEPESPDKNLGHSIIIPYNLFTKFASNINENPLMIQLGEAGNCVVFSNIDTTTDEIVVIPSWVLNKLNLQLFDLVELTLANDMRKVKYMKVWSDISDYVYWDNLKERMEQSLISRRVIGVGYPIIVKDFECGHVEFYVRELRDTEGIQMLDGSIFEADVEIDFETPSDILEKERQQNEELVRLAEEKRLAEEALRQVKEKEDSYKVGGTAKLPDSREARAAFYAKRFG